MIELIALKAEELNPYLEAAIPRYAGELAHSGNAPAEHALESARAQFKELLPDGLDTPDQYLFALWKPATGEVVGALWLGVRSTGTQPFAALYDLYVEPNHRRRGYALQALEALEVKTRDLGFDCIRLHVFAHNRAARALYHRAGYVETDVTMGKSVR